MIDFRKKHGLLEEQKSAVKKAVYILFGLAGINLLAATLLGVALSYNPEILIGGLIGALIYLGLALWSRTKPFPAILAGFFTYVVFVVADAVLDPATILRGMFIKGFIIYGFYYGYRGAKEAERIEAELKLVESPQELAEEP